MAAPMNPCFYPTGHFYKMISKTSVFESWLIKFKKFQRFKMTYSYRNHSFLELHRISKPTVLLQKFADVGRCLPENVGSCYIYDDKSNVACVRCIHYGRNYGFKLVRKPGDPDYNKNSLSHTHLKDILQKCESVEEQIEAFHSYTKLNQQDMDNRKAACQDIEAIFKPHFPSCSLYPIGSTVTGLGLKGCDVDLSFQFEDDKNNQTISTKDTKTTLTKDIETGKVPTSAFSTLHQKQKMHFLRKILKDSGIEGVIIPGRFPIVNFTYQHINFDLGFDNKLGLHGTNFMLLCEKLDSRIAPLFRLISYWAKHSKLCGGPLKFKSYALFLLVVYFLQTRYPSVLPPVGYMFEKADFLKNVGNWSYDVCKYVDKFKKSENSQNIEELLREFFSFYANFDFSCVICTTTKELLEREHFICRDDPENNKFELNTISIQDPLNLDWNVTTGVSWKYSRHFIKELLSVCEICQERHYWTPTIENWGILSLMNTESTFTSIRTKKSMAIKFPLTACPITQSSVEKQNQYLKTVAESVLNIFSHCLNFQCKPVDSSTNLRQFQRRNKSKKANKKHLKSTENDELMVADPAGSLLSRFICVTSDTWAGRSNFHSQNCNRIDKNFFDVEHEISKTLCDSRKGNEKDDFHFTFECWAVPEEDKINFTVILEPVNSDVFIPKLGIFLKEYIPRCINETFSNK